MFAPIVGAINLHLNNKERLAVVNKVGVMRKVFKAILNPKPGVLRICCSDPRFRIAFRDFTAEILGLKQGDFVPINVAGGPAALAHRIARNVDYHSLVDQISFFLNHFTSIRKIVIIGHQDCGYYRNLRKRPAHIEWEKQDLPQAAIAIKRKFHGIVVECYYANFLDTKREEIVFERC